ncbi:MAG: 6-phosphofructokinase [Pontiella sp.]|nr:6-phosphofructokinase [Pontiella sp.]MBT8046083.1 6-phosphofructokinase [Pontiella sp.]NNJ70955.1 6-phosphofructokinase [Kiritimatiellales bacterium]
MTKHNLIIAQGGGPTAVINASLAGVVAEAQKHPEIDRIFAGHHGIEGMMKEDFIDVTEMSATDIERLKMTPSSAVGSCRYKVSEKDHDRIIEVLRKNNIKYFFYNGGNDSMDTCNKVSKIAGDIIVTGVPKTIDNDLAITDHCPGFGSAARFAATATLEYGLDIRALPIHVGVIEVMGRNAGWLVAATALARTQGFEAPHLIYFPERSFDRDQFVADVKAAQEKYGYGIVVAVSEGICYANGEPVADSGMVDGFGHKIPGGTAQALSNILLQEGIKSRAEKPGLTGRASKLTIAQCDVDEAFEAGKIAVKSAVEGKSGYMVGYKRVSSEPYKIEYELIELEKVANVENVLPDNFINEAGNDVTDAFVEYCKPLIGGELEDYFKFDF